MSIHEIADRAPKTLSCNAPDILDAAIARLVHDAQPELRALVLLQPEAENLLGAVGTSTECDMRRLVADDAFVADLDLERVEEDQGTDRL